MYKYEGPVAVIRLELDLSDSVVRRRVQSQWSAVFQLRRALQRDAAARCRAYWAAHRERSADPKAARERLGLSRKALEAAARAHIEASGWMRDHLTKAVGQHVADEVWEAIDRHLFTDSAGHRHGAPKIGSWWRFNKIPGRARSYTKDIPIWETWRLVGTLEGHLRDFRHPDLTTTVTNATDAATEPAGSSILAQPRKMPIPSHPRGSWRTHTGPLTVVFTGLPAGDLVMPVRLPQGAGQWAHLRHFLADPAVWHKIDMVRVRDRKAPGGWRYYAHLLTRTTGYVSPGNRARRATIPSDRRAGLDVNVSNLTLASFSQVQPQQLIVSAISLTVRQQQAAKRAAKRARDRQRALDRSRRNTNADQYGPSARQRKRGQRRAAKGLQVKTVANPGGARTARSDGVPIHAYSRDTLSARYWRIRTDHAAEARATRQAKQARARHIAARIVTLHGNYITVEQATITTWARLWGKRIALFSPGMLAAALAAECDATGGRLDRAPTRTTAMSQHCLCGQRVNKTLAQRIHRCFHCGLHADRDVVSAALAACVEFGDAHNPRTARVNYRLAHALKAGLASQQEWEGSVNRYQPPTPIDGVGSARSGSHHTVASAERAALALPPNRPGPPGRRGSGRKHPASNWLGGAAGPTTTGQLLPK
jgi:hypothetical protein